MRQIGKLPDKLQAHRFSDFLVTLGIDAFAEEEDDDWVVWVRNEDHLPEAREHLTNFTADPSAAKYVTAATQADRVRKEQELQRRARAKHQVDVRTQVWGPPQPRRIPLTLTLIGISVGVAVISGFGQQRMQAPLRQLAFMDPIHLLQSNQSPVDGWQDIKAGQLWRLVTPIFIHYGGMHILFNMLMMYPLASVIEIKRGAATLGVFVIVIAIISNCGEYLLGQSTAFGGMSGVLYGLFGFVWIRMLRFPDEGFRIPQQTVGILLVWLVLGFTGALRHFGLEIANWAHLLGLFAGVGLATLLPPFRRR